MALVTRKQVESNLGQVSSFQIGRCTKVYDFQLKANIYMVLSERDDLTEYRVTYDKKHHCFCCTCPSGENGFSNVKHPSGVCKHVRWACAASAEEKAALAALSAKQDTCSHCHLPASDGILKDTGMLAWMAARAAGQDINLGRPSWMMR
jgi:hypothetical protein